MFRISPVFLLVIALPLSGALADGAVSSSSSSAPGAPACTDSDGGLNYAVRGTVKGWDDAGVTKEFTDACGTRGKERLHLIEYRCLSRSYVQKVVVPCPYDCRDGACLRRPASVIKKPVSTPKRTPRVHIPRGRNGER